MCQGCVITLHQAIIKFFNNTESTGKFLINHGVFPRAVKFPNYGSDCKNDLSHLEGLIKWSNIANFFYGFI